jgi:hypothetical protein
VNKISASAAILFPQRLLTGGRLRATVILRDRIRRLYGGYRSS